MSLPHVWWIQATISHSTCQVEGGRELIAIRYQSFYCGSRQFPVAPTRLVKKCMQASHLASYTRLELVPAHAVGRAIHYTSKNFSINQCQSEHGKISILYSLNATIQPIAASLQEKCPHISFFITSVWKGWRTIHPLVTPLRLERRTVCLEGRCSNPLS